MTGVHPDDHGSGDYGRKRGRRIFQDHPENDLTADADFANLRRPEPQTPEELASTVDPAVQAQKNQQSTRQAISWLFGIPISTVIVAFLLLLITRNMGGPLCDSGESTWLCTESSHIWWPLVTSIIPLTGILGCAFIMNHKLKTYTRWRPWMGVFWVLIPLSMLWMVNVGQILVPAISP